MKIICSGSFSINLGIYTTINAKALVAKGIILTMRVIIMAKAYIYIFKYILLSGILILIIIPSIAMIDNNNNNNNMIYTTPTIISLSLSLSNNIPRHWPPSNFFIMANLLPPFLFIQVPLLFLLSLCYAYVGPFTQTHQIHSFT